MSALDGPTPLSRVPTTPLLLMKGTAGMLLISLIFTKCHVPSDISLRGSPYCNSHWQCYVPSPVPRRLRCGFCAVHTGSHPAASILSDHQDNGSDNEMTSVELLLCARQPQSAQRVFPTDAVTHGANAPPLTAPPPPAPTPPPSPVPISHSCQGLEV